MHSADISKPDHDGFVMVRYNDKTLSLRFSWAVLDALQKELGDDFIVMSSKALNETDIASITTLASKASGLSYEELQAQQMPIMAVRDAVASAWQYAFFGGELPDEEEDEKKTLGLLTLLSRLWRRG